MNLRSLLILAMIASITGCKTLEPKPSDFTQPKSYISGNNSEIFGYKIGNKFSPEGFFKYNSIGTDTIYQMSDELKKNRKRQGYDYNLTNLYVVVENSTSMIRGIVADVERQSFSQLTRNKLPILKTAWQIQKSEAKGYVSYLLGMEPKKEKATYKPVNPFIREKITYPRYALKDNGLHYFVREVNATEHRIVALSPISSLKSLLESIEIKNPSQVSGFFSLSYHGDPQNPDGTIRQNDDGKLHTFGYIKDNREKYILKRGADENGASIDLASNSLYGVKPYKAAVSSLDYYDDKLTELLIYIDSSSWWTPNLYWEVDNYNYWHKDFVQYMNTTFNCKFKNVVLDKISKNMSVAEEKESCDTKNYKFTFHSRISDVREKGYDWVHSYATLKVEFK